MMDDDENLGGLDSIVAETQADPVSKPSQEEKASEPAKPAEPEQAAQPRDESGRFAPKDAKPPAAVEPQQPAAAQPVQEPAKPQDDRVPVEQFKGYLEEREKRKQLEAELQNLKQQQALQVPQQPIPDPNLDPQGYYASIQAQLQQQQRVIKLETSELYAREKYGDAIVDETARKVTERVEKEVAALGHSPFAIQMFQDSRPAEWAIKQIQRDDLFSQYGNDPQAIRQKIIDEYLASQNGAQPIAQPAQAAASPQQAQIAQPRPTPSLASAASAGVATKPAVPDVDRQSLDELFK